MENPIFKWMIWGVFNPLYSETTTYTPQNAKDKAPSPIAGP